MDDVVKRDDGTATQQEEKPRPARRSTTRKPEWANGLKRFYDSVVEEPLPDDLTALLSKLDDGSRA